MLRRFLAAGVMLAVALFSACDDTTSPEGSRSVATVHAYVDVDGSGNISAGDDPIAGLTITLSDDDGTTESAQTNASGVASFSSLRPGSYTVTLSGNVPDGAVLATASTPILVAPFRGDSVAQEFRFVYNPGSLSGALYRDNNGNNTFDAGDTPAPGMPIRLFRGTDTTAAPVATDTTDSTGAFSFPVLRPGSYTMVITPIPTIQIVGGNAQQVTVSANAPTAVWPQFTGNLVQPIAEVRDQPAGSVVAFEGIATVSLNIFSTSPTGNQFNVQDATGGILILDTPLTAGIQQGDSVRVIGTTQLNGGEFLIRNPTLTVLATGRPVPAPRTVTAAQVAASTAESDIQGLLVRVGNVRVTAVSGTAASTSYNVTVDDGTANSFIVRVGSANVGIPQTYWQVGRSYDITGALGNFNGAQVKVRSAADVDLRSSATPIGTVRAMAFADSAGTRFDTVTVEGVIHTAQGTFRNDNAFIQDNTGGILLFNVPTTANLIVGDSVRVTAAIDWFNRELELVRFSTTSPPVIERLGTGATPQPRSISGGQMLSRAFEGQLIRLDNARADSIGAVSGTGGYTVWVVTTDGSRVQIRIENTAIGIPAVNWTVGSYYNVAGALSHFQGAPQLKPRSAADVTTGTAGVITIAAAKARANGDTVVVQGIVTAPIGLFNTTANAYIDDGTGGIQIFGIPAGITLELGELIRVRGRTDVFSGEEQIARFSSTSLLEVTEIAPGPPPMARPVTGAEVLARTYEGSLVQLDSVVVLSVPAAPGAGYNVDVRARDGSTIVIRNDRAAVGVDASTFVVGAAYDITGILSAFNSTPQLKFRGPADVVRR